MNKLPTSFLNSLYRLFIFTLVIFVLGEIGRKVAMHNHLEFVRYTAIAKTIVIVAYLAQLMRFSKLYFSSKLNKKLLLSIVFLVLIFLLSMLVIKDKETSVLHRIKENLVYLSRFLYFPLTFLVFLPLLKNRERLSKLFTFFEIVFFFFAFTIILGIIFDLHVFRTYIKFTRYGYMGVYNSNNQASFYFIFMIVYYYYQTFYNKTKPYKLIFTIVLSVFIGTKKIYLFLVLLLIFDTINFKRYKQKIFWTSVFVVSGIVFLFQEKITLLITDKFDALTKVYEDFGFFTALASYRDLGTIRTVNEVILPKWIPLNYLIGGSEFYSVRPEMEFLDIVYFFGIAGLLFYIWFVKQIITYLQFNRFLITMTALIILISGLAGGFFISANQPIIYLLIFSCLSLQINSTMANSIAK